MMFALPAGALAIWRNAKPQNRKLVGGIMLSAALTSFVTGITEPLEYSFMFVAFPLSTSSTRCSPGRRWPS